MRYEPEKIEEKMIPFIEGVLNSREHREVEEAIDSNSQLAREVTDLREVIDGLREGFADGVKPPQEKLSPEEVVEMAGSAGGVESLRGSSEQKARLFCSDEALEELALLRALQEEMERTSLDIDSAPPLPESLRAEFLRLDSGSAKVIPLARRLSPVPLWRRASQFLDRIDPKPLMASAAALALLSLGVHFYQNPMVNTANAPQVASGFSDEEDRAHEFGKMAAATPAAPEPLQEEEGGEADLDNERAARTSKADTSASQPVGNKRADKSVEPSGVAVFTSDDPDLLKQQAGKLLEKKIRYTVTQDRILVADKDVKPARDVLWTKNAVASADEEETEIEETDFTRHVAKDSPQADGAQEVIMPAPRRPVRPAPPVVDRDPTASPVVSGEVKVYSNRPATAPKPAAAKPRMKEVQAYQRPAGRRVAKKNEGTFVNYSEKSALKPKGQSSASTVSTGSTYRPAPEPARKTSKAAPAERTEVSNVTTERRQKLRELALGEDQKAKAPEVVEVSQKDDDWTVPESAVGGTGKASTVQTQTRTRARVNQVPSQTRTAPVANAVTLENNDRGYREQGVAMQERVNAGAPPAPAEPPGGQILDTLDTRLAAIQSVRGTVANRYGVKLSVESRGGKVTVYVRPKSDLTKAELNELRSALRRDLGLAETDTIIFR